MDEVTNFMLSFSLLQSKALIRSREMMVFLGDSRIFFIQNSTNFTVTLTGSMYKLSFAYCYRKEEKIETALISPDNRLMYIKGLNYYDVLNHDDTTEACLNEVERVEYLLNQFANKIRTAWLNYKRRKDAIILIQRAYRKARDNPAYALCEQIQMRHLDDIGCQLCD